MTTRVTTVDLLRHGEPQGGEMFRGHTDLPLTDLGWQQMHGAVETARDIPWQRVVSSPLQRCNDFALHIAETHSIPHCQEDAMREISFGDWDGVSFETIRREQKQALKQYWQNVVEHTPPNGETMLAFRERVVSSWQQMLDRHAGEHLLLVAHGGVIRILLALTLDMPLPSITRLNVPYACFSRIQIYEMKGHAPWLQLQFHQGRLD